MVRRATMSGRLGRTAIVLAAGVGLMAVVALAGQRAATREPEPSPLSSISRKSLDSARVNLSEPDSNQTREAARLTAKERAEDAALSRWPGASLVESRLLQVEDRLSDPPFRCLCWVVVVNRPDPIYIGGPAPVGGISRDDFLVEETYRFDLIDAYTGEYLFGVEGAVGRAVPSSQNPD
jgi:hypothetical protein